MERKRFQDGMWDIMVRREKFKRKSFTVVDVEFGVSGRDVEACKID